MKGGYKLGFIFENKVKELRARHHVTQQELADFLGMKVVNLRKREYGMSLWKESEMHLVVYFFNSKFGECLTLTDVFQVEIIE